MKTIALLGLFAIIQVAVLSAPPGLAPKVRGVKWVFAIPYVHHGVTSAESVNFLYFHNDRGREVDVTVTYRSVETELTVPSSGFIKIALEYVEPQENSANSAILADAVVTVEVDPATPTRQLSLVFEQYFGAGDPNNKITLIIPEQKLTHAYTVPAPPGNNGPMIIASLEPTERTDITIQSATDTALKISDLPDQDELALQNSLPGFDGAKVTADDVSTGTPVNRPIAVMAADGARRMTMVLPDTGTAATAVHFALPPGEFLIYSTGANPALITVDGSPEITIPAGGRYRLGNSANARMVTAAEPVSVFQETANDWIAIPHVGQYPRDGRIAQFLPPTGETSVEVIIISSHTYVDEGSLSLDGIGITDWTEIGEVDLGGASPEKFHWAHVTADGEALHRITVNGGSGEGFMAIVYNDAAGYVPAMELADR